MSITAYPISALPFLPPGPSARSFAFEQFVLCPERQLLTKCGIPVRVGGRALDLLTALVERPGELVDKQALVARAWPTTFVDEANLKVNMASLRRALGESHTEPAFIATVVGRGYRFIAPVRASDPRTISPVDDGLVTTARIAGLIGVIEAIREELQQIRNGSPQALPDGLNGISHSRA
jgi:DNA-binding winged helix-turn-helix (wHTH) protein